MALESNVDLRLPEGLLPVSYVFDLFLICNFALIHICLSPMRFTAPTLQCAHISSCYPHLINSFPTPRSILLSLTVLRPQIRFLNSQLSYGDRLSTCRPTPKLEEQSTVFIAPGAGWPSYTARLRVSCMGYSRTVLFPGHHTWISKGSGDRNVTFALCLIAPFLYCKSFAITFQFQLQFVIAR
jgi:hypothetical protein